MKKRDLLVIPVFIPHEGCPYRCSFCNQVKITGVNVQSDEIVIKSTYPGQTSITTLGTIATGTWQGTVIDEVFGGTGQSSYTTGDVLYASGANTLAKLALGASGKILQSNGSNVTYGDIDGGTY